MMRRLAAGEASRAWRMEEGWLVHWWRRLRCMLSCVRSFVDDWRRIKGMEGEECKLVVVSVIVAAKVFAAGIF